VNTATKFTVMRILLVPLYIISMYLGKNSDAMCYTALGIFILASLTDLLDGHIARKYNQVTDLGKFLDPLADKVLVLSAMSIFCQWGRFPAWVLMIVVAREFAVTGLRLIAANKGKVLAAGWSGKVKTVVTMIVLCFMMGLVAKWPSQLVGETVIRIIDWVGIAAIVATTLYSGGVYFVQNRDILR